jgi:uncharacterized protein YceK
MRNTIAFFTAALVGLTGGCGIVRNLYDDHPEVYGGVARDVEFLLTPNALSSGDTGGTGVLLALWAADLCASGVADTLTLPFLYRSGRRARERLDPAGVLDDPVRPQYSVGANAPPP